METSTLSIDTWETASVELIDRMHFAGEVDGRTIDLDADASAGGHGAGPRPLRLLLLGMAGCTAMDVIAILRKKRQDVAMLRVVVRGQRVEEHPRVYDRFEVIYQIHGSDLDPAAVARAIELSETRYCPAIAMLRHAASITSSFEICDEPTSTTAG
jgi:putative redox protein